MEEGGEVIKKSVAERKGGDKKGGKKGGEEVLDPISKRVQVQQGKKVWRTCGAIVVSSIEHSPEAFRTLN